MSFTLPKASNSSGAAIPVGLYLVTLKHMEMEHREDGPYGPQDRVKWIFTIDEVLDADDDDALDKVGEELWSFTNSSMHVKATMRGYVEALLGRAVDEDEEVSTADLLGKRAKASVVPHTKQDGTKTTKLGTLTPYKRARRAAAEDEGPF